MLHPFGKGKHLQKYNVKKKYMLEPKKRFSHQFHENSPYRRFSRAMVQPGQCVALGNSHSSRIWRPLTAGQARSLNCYWNQLDTVMLNGVMWRWCSEPDWLRVFPPLRYRTWLTCSQPQVLALKINMLNIYTWMLTNANFYCNSN